nr:Unknown Function [uncultured bacterium]
MHPPARYTLTEVEWDVMVAAMHTELIEIAKQRRIVTYSELALMLPVYIHPGSYTFTRLLSRVCGDAERAGEGLLCALVVSKATGIPGGGYFTGIAERGCVEDDPIDCWRADVERVFARWEGQ